MTRWIVWGAIVACVADWAAAAAPMGAAQAAGVVQGWLRQDARPLGQRLSPGIEATETVRDASGNAIYHVVHLARAGYVIVSADDALEPIIAFSAKGRFRASAPAGVAAWVNRDLPRRSERARAGAGGEGERKARRKWRSALAASPSPPPDLETNDLMALPSTIWVAPFVRTLWNQQTDVSGRSACYNYYTPPFAAGSVSNYYCGCVATALAQVLCYFQYPATGVGTNSFTISVDETNTTASLRGGDGNGGPYQWADMPLAPNNPAPAQAQAVGALCFDAAVAVNMEFAADGSSADDSLAGPALQTTFQFANADYGFAENGLAGTSLLPMINPNLDARLPVILGIEPASGHEAVCDGYGYSGSTLFHHLNMGWGGDDDVWYALPNIDTLDNADFTMVSACVCNVFTNGAGQVLSGRIVDASGAAVAGAGVTATGPGGLVFAAMTDTNGIYALTRLPPNTQFALTATNVGGIPVSASYTTGKSQDGGTNTGNVWGANFILSPPLLAMPGRGFAAIGPVGGPFNPASRTYTLTNSTAASINWAASSPAAWLAVTPANGAVAARAASSFSLSLGAAAASLPAGSNSTTVWLTNLATGLAQELEVSLAVETADYPIAITGYNDDVVVENTAAGGNSLLYADTFDSDNADFTPAASFCFYQHGLVAVNFGSNNAPAVQGLPESGLFTSAADGATTFQLGPYAGYNVLALWAGAPSGILLLSEPLAYKSLSVLAATAEGGGHGSLVLNFADGTSSPPLAFNAPNYYTTNFPGGGAALNRFGVLQTGEWNEYYVFERPQLFPTLYQTSINLASLGLSTKPISSITFTMPGSLGTNAVTGVFALSGTQAPYPVVTNPPMAFVTGAGGVHWSGDQLVLQLTNLAGQAAVVLSASTNLTQWVPLFTNSPAFGTLTFTDSAARMFPRRFYRAATP